MPGIRKLDKEQYMLTSQFLQQIEKTTTYLSYL